MNKIDLRIFLPAVMLYALIIAVLLIGLQGCAYSDNIDADKIADAIYWAEGGYIKHPYGILSIKCTGLAECRKICINTIKNNYKRWQSALQASQISQNMPYLEFLALKYAPVQGDPTGLNKNWLKNVRWYLEHPKPIN